MTDDPALLDVNVLVALLWSQHRRHGPVRLWFRGARERTWATCPLTELGAARILANPIVSQGALSPAGAARLVRELTRDQHHVFWPDGLSLSDTAFDHSLDHMQGHNQFPDRYLLVLAADRGGVLASLDRSTVSALPPDSPLRARLELIQS